MTHTAKIITVSTVSQKNAPTLPLSSYELHGLILIFLVNIIRLIVLKIICIFNFNVFFTFNNCICC